MVDHMGHAGRRLVVAVLVILLLAPGQASIAMAIGSDPGMGALSQPGPSSGRWDQGGFNDPDTGSIGTPVYYGSLVSIIGTGNIVGEPQEIYAIDVDGDDILEIATLTAQGFVQVLGLGPSGYDRVIWRSPVVPGGSRAFAIGDMDGDDLDDLVMGDGSGQVYVFDNENLLNPNLGPAATGRTDAPYTVSTIGLMDMNEDGRLDIISHSRDNYNMTLIHNLKKGPGNETDRSDIYLEMNRTYHQYFDIHDFMVVDLEGHQDDFILGFKYNGDSNGYMYRINKTRFWSDYTTNIFEYYNVDVLDLDGDDLPEIIISEYHHVLVLNSTDLEMKWEIYREEDQRIYGVQAGDFDNDGEIEIITFEHNRNSLVKTLAIVNVSSQQYEGRMPFEWKRPYQLNHADLDNDTYQEIIFSDTYNLRTFSLVPDNGTNITNITLEATSNPIGYDTYGIDTFDVDDDGTKEIVSGSRAGTISVLEPFTGEVVARNTSFDFCTASIIVADLDLDGTKEIVTGNEYNLSVFNKDLELLYFNMIREVDIIDQYLRRTPMVVLDVDGDGYPEIIQGTQLPTIEVFNGTDLVKESWRNYQKGQFETILVNDLDHDGIEELIVADTKGQVILINSSNLKAINTRYIDYAPYGLVAADLDDDGEVEILAGSADGYVDVLNSTTLIPEKVSPKLGWEAWGLQYHDLDGDGEEEVLVGTGDGKLVALDGLTLQVEWTAEIGEWIGPYNSLKVEDLDGDGRLEIVAGSDGYVYVLRLELQSQKPDIEVHDISLEGVTGNIFENGEEIEVNVTFTVTGLPLNISFDLWVEPNDPNTTGIHHFGHPKDLFPPGTHAISANLTTAVGSWKIMVKADPDDRYSEYDEGNNLMSTNMTVIEGYANIEWAIGQGTGLGRYGGMVLADDDADGRPELMVGNSEGFVRTFQVSGVDHTIENRVMTFDLGQGAYGIVAMDVDTDGETEVVISTGDGKVYSYQDVAGKVEWMTWLSEGACYGLHATDIDGNGGVEVVVGCENSKLYILDGEDGSVRSEVTLPYELWALDSGDLGGDGSLNLVVGAQDGTVHILDAATLVNETSFRLGDTNIDDILVEDIDLDGRKEMVFGDRSGKVFVVDARRNEAPWLPPWTLNIDVTISTGSPVKGLDVMDLLPEPGPELVVASKDGVRIYNSSFGMVSESLFDETVSGLVVGDVDTDGSAEIMVGTTGGDLYVLGLDTTGSGTSVVVLSSIEGVGPGLYGTAIGDLDGDKAMDLVLGTSRGELQVYDSISKGLKHDLNDMGIGLYGLAVMDVDGDGDAELITGSGDEVVCALDGGDLTVEWCTDKLGNWTIALAAMDLDDDGGVEVVVGAGGKVFILDGGTGAIEQNSYSFGENILGLVVGDLDDDPGSEIVVGTDDGFLHILDGANLSKEWGLLLDSWPVGMDMVDVDGDGIGELFVGTDSKVYLISHLDREILWETDLGQGGWGLAAGDPDGDGNYEVFVGTRNGKIVSLDAGSGAIIWMSRHLGGRAGWYNSMDLADVDQDGQMELLVGSSGYLYLFAVGGKEPVPVSDIVVQEVTIPDVELVHGQEIEVNVTIYNHGTKAIDEVSVHLQVDGRFMDSTVLERVGGLGTEEVTLTVEVEGGFHDLTVIADVYDTIDEYNEDNNNLTLTYVALNMRNLAFAGGPYDLYLSSEAVEDVEVTVFAVIENRGEELAQGTVRFYWGDLRPIGEDTVSVKGSQKVVAAVNWTPTEPGEWDITVVVDPWGVDIDPSDNIGTRKLDVLTHPSVRISSVSVPALVIEGYGFPMVVNVTNLGEARSVGEVVLYIDGEEAWRSGDVIFEQGVRSVVTDLTMTAGTHDLFLSLEGLTLDDDTEDNILVMNMTVLTRPDLHFDMVTTPDSRMLKPGRELLIGVMIRNDGGADATCVLKVFDNGVIFFEEEVTVAAGEFVTVQVPWKATKGDHEVTLVLEAVTPEDTDLEDNEAYISMFVQRPEEEDDTWVWIILIFVGVITPLVAGLIYHSQVQPVRRMYTERAREVTTPVRRRRRRPKRVKKVKKVARPKKVKKALKVKKKLKALKVKKNLKVMKVKRLKVSRTRKAEEEE